MKLWKSMLRRMKSAHGPCKWKIGEWKTCEEKPSLCNVGFHASINIQDAMRYVNCHILALVEVKGYSDIGWDKQAWSKMRVIRAYKWTKKDSVELAIFSARLCLPIFEKTIKAAEAWIKNPNKKNREAALNAAASLHNFINTKHLDYNTACAAYAAFNAACAAHASENNSAYNAACAASAAAYAIHATKVNPTERKNKIERWLLKKVKTLKKIK